jgi:hypothetical protein
VSVPFTRYDVLHNWHLGLHGTDELHELAKHFADCIVPQEYGVDKEEKRILGSHMCQVTHQMAWFRIYP